ncbi:MAG TPA: type IV pilin protein [Burkholderiaceae bacterium]
MKTTRTMSIIHPRRRAAAGFTLIETLAALAIVGVLAGIAYPSFEGPILKARRTEGLVALMTLQMAQERWRSNNRRYATLSELGTSAATPTRLYTLQVVSADEDGYELRATAMGVQARDRACRRLSLSVSGGNVVHASGADAESSNDASANRRCWGL